MIHKLFIFCCLSPSWLTLSPVGYSAAGECPADGIRIKAGDPNPFDTFGRAVGVSGDTVVVGAEWDDQNGFDSGAAYIFQLENQKWEQTQKLFSSDGVSGDEFGARAAIDEDALLITGLQHVDDDAPGTSAVYGFRRNGASWLEIQELLASDGAFGDGFGVSVGLSGDTAIIGAPSHDDGGSGSGAAYVFRFDRSTSEWIEESKLTASDPMVSVNFGLSVALADDIAVIGTPGDSSAYPEDPFCGHGAAYFFRFDEETELWVEEAKVIASDPVCLDRFGWDVAVSGDTALIGAQWHEDNGTSSGAVYVFRFDPKTSQWIEQQKLLASDGVGGDQFGRALAMDGDLAVVGAWKADAVNENSGAAYVFRRNALGVWVEQCKLLPQPNVWTQRFGWSVDIDGRRVIIGAHGEDQQQGAAYIFDLSFNPADLDADGTVGPFDLALLLGNWGPCPEPCTPGDPAQTCPADLNGDCAVGAFDLAILLGDWGPCQ